ncbi:hypothetical protein Francci3_2730 [Frankia casuarinae]|uniref:Uncharacterized protein n=1 Tax=Frankia casuarinae (strain DSM 45818 / CECT 9043 / HFP020203 / CcI3) TaxID=106370 RepID=Q2J9F2_FRACC|nr:hypothetical protein Francci3_2730 [Frankia casuarinae]
MPPTNQPLPREFIHIPERTNTSDLVLSLTGGVSDLEAALRDYVITDALVVNEGWARSRALRPCPTSTTFWRGRVAASGADGSRRLVRTGRGVWCGRVAAGGRGSRGTTMSRPGPPWVMLVN